MSPAVVADALKNWVIVHEMWRERIRERAWQLARCAQRAARAGRTERALALLDGVRRHRDTQSWWFQQIGSAVRTVRDLERQVSS